MKFILKTKITNIEWYEIEAKNFTDAENRYFTKSDLLKKVDETLDCQELLSIEKKENQ